MQKYILKKQFEGFSVSNSKGLHKGYDRFQSLLSQLEIYVAGFSTKDANQKFLRLYMPHLQDADCGICFWTLAVLMKFVLLIGPQLDHEDLEQLDEFDLEEMDLKWQVAMISMRLKKFYKKTGRKLQFDAKEPVVFDKAKEGILLENADLRGIKIVGGEMLDTLGSALRYAEGMLAVPPLMDRDLHPFWSRLTVTLTSMLNQLSMNPIVVVNLSLWSDALIIEEYESDSDDECVTTTLKEQEQPSFAFINTVKHVKTPRQIIKEQNTCSQIPKPDKKDYSDCDFHEKRMAKQAELNKRMCKGTGQRENRIIHKEQNSSIVKNSVFHSKTKHIEIRHHFIRDAYEKKLIQAALVKGRQDDLLYSLYGMFCEQKNLDNEASIRSDLLFDDADRIDTLNNQAIFDTIQLMGFLQIFLRNQLRDVLVPVDHFPVPALTKKVLTFMVKKGKNFLVNVTPLFPSMLVQPTEDEGEVSERPSES
ncbi:hypothetical protein Tco_1051049 [Tanacetum coccineum]